MAGSYHQLTVPPSSAIIKSDGITGTACLHGSCRQNYFGPVVLWWVWDGSFSLAFFQVARFSVSDDAAVNTSLLLNGPFGVSLWRCIL